MISCPFCGDLRRPTTEKVTRDSQGEIFAAVCQHCGAQGPVTITRGGALVLWDNRGGGYKFEKLFNKVNPS